MKLTIHDFLDGYTEETLDIQSDIPARREKIKELTMNKITQTQNTKRRPRRFIALLAAAAAVLALSGAAWAVSEWTGFARTGDMSDAAVNQLLEEASIGMTGEEVAPDGTTTYYDADGNVTAVMSAEEAAAYESELTQQQEDAVRASTDLLDMDTVECIPASVTELAVAGDGTIDDFALGNGHMVILCTEEGGGYSLQAGDTVTLSLDSGEPCAVELGMIRGGEMLETVTIHYDAITHTFTVPSDGEYCFSVLYASVDADNFTNGSLMINSGE